MATSGIRRKFVSMNVTIPARDLLQRTAAVIFPPLIGRRVSMSEALIAALAVAERHPDEVADQLSQQAQPTQDQE